ncbi:hypothetical protein RD110_14120 [Rhodoferax koreense]|uniref:Metallo-beta-lactamase domain-containing protein n=1 Tax=Rhodoferax koreensis TaxID=1842727 RepID=A0A1P8JWS7_9BURK|nr:hypothetical protein RD110_14120 [Rhodoferax koreense]
MGHASLLVEANGVSILSDPWWQGPCFGAQWWVYPAPHLAAVTDRRIDYIYISHGHHDHLHPGTLNTFDRTTRVLVSSALDLAAGIREMGFEVIEVPDDDSETDLGQGVKVRIRQTHGGDTLFCVSDGKEVLVNLNDALHSATAEVQRQFSDFLRRAYPAIDYLFCGYGVASHFPNCYVVPGQDRGLTAARRQQYFNRQWVSLVRAIQPKFGFPFAADVVFLENDLSWANEPTHNSERPVDVFKQAYPDAATQVYDIAPGFCIDGGRVVDAVLRTPLVNARILNELKDQVQRANRYGSESTEQVQAVRDLFAQCIDKCQAYLAEFRGDYRMLIRPRAAAEGIVIEKQGQRFAVTTVALDGLRDTDFDLAYRARLVYLKNALTTSYGNEILFVGSGGIFEYFSTAAVKKRLHVELITLLRASTGVPKSRYGGQSYYQFAAKQWVKRLLRVKSGMDLYDLDAWTVYKGDRLPA